MQRILWRMGVLVLGLMLVIVGAARAERGGPDNRDDRAIEQPAVDDPGDGNGAMMYHIYGMMQHMRGMMHGMQEGRGLYGHMGEEVEDDLPWGAMTGLGMRYDMHGMMGRHGRGHGHHLLRKMARLADDLGLSEQQERQIRVLLRAHMKQAIQIRAELAAKRIDLLEQLDAETVDLAEVKALLHNMAKRRADLRYSHLSLMQEIKQQLTPEQRKKFRARSGVMMHGYGLKSHGERRGRGPRHHYRHETGPGRGMGRGMGMGRHGMRNPCGRREAPDKDR